MNNLIPTIPENYIQLFLVVAFSLVIGLSQRKLQIRSGEGEVFFGSDRTFTLIGILGYVLYLTDPVTKVFWGCGGIGLLILLGFYYYFKIYHLRKYGFTSIVIACITYCIPALVISHPLPFTLLVLVIVLVLTEMKETFISMANRMNSDEFITLAKFIIIAGVILPILPNERIFESIDLTPRTVWMATVIISGMSYVSYLLQKFVFRDSGLLVAGVLGGLYSSTATTVVLSRKSKLAPEPMRFRYTGAIILASAMMFIRLAVLLLIFNATLFEQIWSCFLIMFLISFATGMFVYYHRAKGLTELKNVMEHNGDKNPLEFKVALIFSSLFVLFTVLTNYVVGEFGVQGLKLLSFAVGVTDITPFLTSLYHGDYAVASVIVASATFGATFSNNIVKMCYAIFWGRKNNRSIVIVGFAVICLANMILLFFL